MVWCKSPTLSPRRLAYRGWLFLHRHVPRLHTTPSTPMAWQALAALNLIPLIVGLLCYLLLAR